MRFLPPHFNYALAWLVSLSLFFFLSYGFANNLAAERGISDSIYFEWEKEIPFLAWTIIPYWSLDLFYGFAFLVTRNKQEVNLLGKRLLMLQIISVFCFVLFPLKFAFERAPQTGLFGQLFDLLMGFDLPFNQAPSLHISISVVLWCYFFHRFENSFIRGIISVWFLLICVSVLTTWQHHFIDVPTGLLVGLFCIWLFPEANSLKCQYSRLKPYRKIAYRYSILSILVCLLGLIINGWGLWLNWLAISLFLVSLNYFSLGVSGFQKKGDGQYSLINLILFAPYMLIMWINSRLWTYKIPKFQHIIENVYIGRIPSQRDLKKHSFNCFLDMTAEFSFNIMGDGIYSNLPILDLTELNTEELTQAAHEIERLQQQGKTLVFCGLGFSRSAAAIMAWLIATKRVATVEEAYCLIQSKRPQIRIRDLSHFQQLT